MKLPDTLCTPSSQISTTWPDSAFTKFKRNAQALNKLAQSAGTGSDRYKLARAEIEDHIQRGPLEKLHSIISSSNHVRALLDIIKETDFLNQAMLSNKLLESLAVGDESLSKLTLLNLISVYFEKYDSIQNQGNLLGVCEFIRTQLLGLQEGSGVTQLSRFKQHAPILFYENSPSALVQRAVEGDVQLDAVFRELGLGQLISGDFMELCTSLYYVEMLSSIPLGEYHHVLEEVAQASVVRRSINQHKKVGHKVLEILIERSLSSGISEIWLETILSIAGDPRVPVTAKKYRDWWAHIQETYIVSVRGWMSQVDLKLFLDVLEESATDEDMRRMYADRKTVIEGLDKLGVISDSRLFLSRQAEVYLKRMKAVGQLPSYKKVNDSNTSMIYLKVGTKHIIEGTHSFRIKVMDKLPSVLPIFDYTNKHVNLADFRGVGFRDLWVQEFGNDHGYIEKTHAGNMGWVNDLITELRKADIDVTEADVVSVENRTYFVKKFGKRQRL